MPSFDLVLATLGRTEELDRFLRSLRHQGTDAVRVLVVDQNGDERVRSVLAGYADLEIMHLHSPPGLSRARNAALPHLRADIVGWPDDDCIYPDYLLARVGEVFAARPELSGLTGQIADPYGLPTGRWPETRTPLTARTLWNAAISTAIFLRRKLVESCGPFDERLGLGAGTPWESAEEIELLVRALRTGARIEYDPSVVVLHSAKQLTGAAERRLTYRDGASVGYILGRHAYGPSMLARMAIRPLGGAVLALRRRDVARARVLLSSFAGRLRGYPAGVRARFSSKNRAS